MINVQHIESPCVLVDFALATITATITDTSFLNKYTTGTFNKLQLSLFLSTIFITDQLLGRIVTFSMTAN